MYRPLNTGFFLVFLTSFALCASAGPQAFLKYDNVKILQALDETNKDLKQKKMIRKVNQAWMDFLDESPAVLLKKNSDYRIDQKCVVEFDLDNEGSVNFDSIKILKKSHDNSAFALKALEFLRTSEMNFKKTDDDPAKITFKYWAF